MEPKTYEKMFDEKSAILGGLFGAGTVRFAFDAAKQADSLLAEGVDLDQVRKDFKADLDCACQLGGRDRWDVFRDFVTLSAIAVSHLGYLYGEDRVEESLEEFKEIFLGLGGTTQRRVECEDCLVSALGCLMAAYELCREQDFLGEFMSENGLYDKKGKGQCFTPYCVSMVAAKLLAVGKCGDKGVADECIGTGSMLIAAVNEARKDGHTPRAFGRDIDRKVAMCAYVQLALLDVPARIAVGDSLLEEEREVWYTPAWFRWSEEAA